MGIPFDCVRKRGRGFNRFRGFNGGGAAHKNIEAPRSINRAMLEGRREEVRSQISNV